jgi:hypothetical protein
LALLRQKQCFEYSYFLHHIAHPPFPNSSITLPIMCKIARGN